MMNIKIKSILQAILLHGAVAIIPNIFLFYTRNANDALNYLPLDLTFMLAGLFAVAGLAVYWGSRFVITKYHKGAMLITLLFWVLFWTFGSLYTFVIRFVSLPRIILFFGVFGLVVVLSILLRKFKPFLGRGKIIFEAMLAVLVLVFLINFSLVLRTEILLSRGTEDFYIKQDFVVDNSLPSPDVYWFFLDGMMNFSTVEELFEDDQAQFKQQLAERGFVINESASLPGTYFSMWGMAALQSPAFYDNWFGDVLQDAAPLSDTARIAMIEDRFLQAGISIPRQVAPNNELFAAFAAAGYTRVIICSPDTHSYPFNRIEYLYFANSLGVYPPLLRGGGTRSQAPFLERFDDWFTLLAVTTPLPHISQWIALGDWVTFHYAHIPLVDQLTRDTFNHPNERALYYALIDSFSIESPKLVMITSLFTHMTGGWAGELLDDNYYSLSYLYMNAHSFVAEKTLRQIDLILADNPNAVIVIQADHGLRGNIEYFIEKGFSAIDNRFVTDSVISAVRIPPQYGSLDAPLDPRNITRVLVNSFVGENYTLIEN